MSEPPRLPTTRDDAKPPRAPAAPRILVAIDDPTVSATAARHAVQLAQSADAELLFLHVRSPLPPDLPSYAAPVYQSPEEHARIAAESEAGSLANAIAMAQAAGVQFRVVHEQDGQPYRGLVRASERHGCTTIVVSCRSRGSGSAYMMGSQTRRLLTHSLTPVLVVAADVGG